MNADQPHSDELHTAPRSSRFAAEVVGAGPIREMSDDELVGGIRGAAGVIGIVILIASLGLFSIWWLVFVVGILIAIFLHELGHFVTARMTGMKATQFFIGFGPRVWSFRRGETEYGVRALPLGAFVKIIGMSNVDATDPADEQRTYRSKGFPQRMLVISAGSLMHMALASVLLFTVYVADGEVADGARFAAVESNGPASTAGLRIGDVVVAIDGEPIVTSGDISNAVVSGRAGDVVEFEILRLGLELTIPVVLATNAVEGDPRFGRPYIGVKSDQHMVDHSVVGAATNAMLDIFPAAWEMTKGGLTVLNPVNVAGHVTGSNNDLSTRPTTLIGVTSISDDVGESQGLIGIVFLLAMLNVFIGVFNMLPLLPLDGGHAAIAIYERIRSRKGQRYYADVAKLMPFATAVVVLLFFLFASGLYLDIADPVG